MSDYPKLQYRVKSNDNIHRLAVTEWNQVKKPVAVLQIVHGMREHIGRYQDFAKYLNVHGVIVVGHDHLGHGDTAETPEDYGYFGDYGGAKLLVKDTSMMTTHFYNKYKNLPLFLLGHSMGSFITRLSVLHTYPLLAGYICIGTAGHQAIMGATRAYVEALSVIRGTQGHTDLTDRFMEQYSLQRLRGSASPDAWISRSSETVQSYTKDPKTRFFFTNQGYADLLDLQLAINKDEWYKHYPVSLHTYLSSGEEDPIGNFGKDIPIIAQRLKEHGVMDVTYKLYPLARHEILNELNKEEVYFDILAWMGDILEILGNQK